MSKFILVNKAFTPDGTILECKHQHDYQEHVDRLNGELYILDGLGYYIRASVNKQPMCHFTLTLEDPHEILREHFKWGRNYTEDMKPLPETEWILLKDLESSHIQNILDGNYCKHPDLEQLFINEQDYRVSNTCLNRY
jgi:hypothetical protein